ncbi:N-acetylneuraminate epimerase [compost metagenome]
MKLNQSKAVIQAAHPGFSQKVLIYNIASNTWTAVPGIMPYGTVTTQAVWFGNEIIIAGGEIKAGVRTPKILSGKIKVTK